MAGDSLGKKHTYHVFSKYLDKRARFGVIQMRLLIEAQRYLSNNPRILNTFSKLGGPSIKDLAKYVNRFLSGFSYFEQQLTTRPNIATGDRLHRNVLIDFIFGTPEAQRAIDGLYSKLISNPTHEISPATHKEFCSWVGIPESDNTRRGPFARWLEDVGFGIPKPDRGKNETSVIVDMCGKKYASAEAFTYGLMREFADPYDGGGLRPVKITRLKTENSLTVKSLFIEKRVSKVIDK